MRRISQGGEQFLAPAGELGGFPHVHVFSTLAVRIVAFGRVELERERMAALVVSVAAPGPAQHTDRSLVTLSLIYVYTSKMSVHLIKS